MSLSDILGTLNQPWQESLCRNHRIVPNWLQSPPFHFNRLIKGTYVLNYLSFSYSGWQYERLYPNVRHVHWNHLRLGHTNCLQDLEVFRYTYHQVFW